MIPNEKVKKAFEAFYESEHKKTRKLWREWIAGSTVETQKLLDAYFDEAYQLVLTRETGRHTRGLKF